MKKNTGFGRNKTQLVEILRAKGIEGELLNAFELVDRKFFVPEHLSHLAYIDEPLSIGFDQTISQPYTVAYMTKLLEVEAGARVLEVGTGSGFQAAILYTLGAGVYTVERIKPLYEQATGRFNKLGYNIKTFWGDGTLGLPQYAPFDRIIVTAGTDKIPENLLHQLADGGIMVIPVKNDYYLAMNKITKFSDDDFAIEKYGAFTFVPLLKGKSL